MLKDNLYTIEQYHESDTDQLQVVIRLSESHPIFKGHFPSQPVLPGVCLVEILKDILQVHTGKEPTLGKASNIKFLKMVNPLENARLKFVVNISVSDDALDVNATSFLEDESANFKFKGRFV